MSASSSEAMASDRLKLEHTFLDFAKSRQWDEVKFLVRATPDLVNVQTGGRWSALQQAASAGAADLVAFLLSYGADASAKTSDGRTPIDMASTDEVRKLLAAAPSRVKLEHGFLDLAKHRKWDALKAAVTKTPDLVNARPSARWPALHQAAQAGNADVVGFLLEHGADINARTTDGRTAMDVASSEDVRRLLEPVKTKLEHAFLDLAKAHLWDEVKRMVKEHPGLVNARPAGRATALEKALRAGNKEMVDFLVAHNAEMPPTGGAATKGRPRPSGEERLLASWSTVPGVVTAGPPGKAAAPAVSAAPAAPAPAVGPARVAPSTTLPLSTISTLEGGYKLTCSGTLLSHGTYIFNPKTRDLSDKASGEIVGTFVDDQASPKPFPEDALRDPWATTTTSLRCVSVVNGEIVEEVQDPANAGAYFVLPSQFNGAEYMSESRIARFMEEYKLDNTGGPRGQLAVHPAAGQFMLDNAFNDRRPKGINAVDAFLAGAKELMATEASRGYDVYLRNGYLALPDCAPAIQADVLKGLRAALHKVRCLGMMDVPARGLAPSFKAGSSATHRVGLFYASAVPVQAYLNAGKVDATFQQEVGRLAIVAQYFGALRLAALRGAAAGSGSAAAAAPARARVFLMPLGGGVFNNRVEAIAGAISTAVELLQLEGIDVCSRLDIRVLSFKGKPSEADKMTALLKALRKAADPSAPLAPSPAASRPPAPPLDTRPSAPPAPDRTEARAGPSEGRPSAAAAIGRVRDEPVLVEDSQDSAASKGRKRGSPAGDAAGDASRRKGDLRNWFSGGGGGRS